MARTGSRVPEVDGVDLDSRPDSYWAPTNALGALLQNVKGQNRREMIEQVATGQSVIPPGTLGDGLLQDSLAEQERASLGSIHPSFMGGEYLPDYIRGEVEIARVVLASVTQDVYSLRVRPLRAGRIRFRMVDEYESGFVIRPASSMHPLSLRELVAMLDRMEGGFHTGHGLIEGIMLNQLESADTTDASDIAGFISVQSTVYQDLENYYDTRLLQEATALLDEHRGDDREENEVEGPDDADD